MPRASRAGLSATNVPLKTLRPRTETFLKPGGIRMVIARWVGSLKSAITLAPLRSTPAPTMLCVTSIWMGRLSRTVPPVQFSTSPVANFARSAASKPVESAAAATSTGAEAACLFWLSAVDEVDASASAEAPPTTPRLLRFMKCLPAGRPALARDDVHGRLSNDQAMTRADHRPVTVTVGQRLPSPFSHGVASCARATRRRAPAPGVGTARRD
jgi:hypothetical protein